MRSGVLPHGREKRRRRTPWLMCVVGGNRDTPFLTACYLPRLDRSVGGNSLTSY